MKILVVQLGKIGDMVLTTPLFRAIKEKFPDAQIHVLASRHGAPVVANHPRLRKIFVYSKDPFRFPALLIRLFLERYDIWIDPKDHYSMEGALLARVSRAKTKAGFNKKGKSVFSHSIAGQEECFSLHASSRNMRALKFLGITDQFDIRPELFPDAILQEATRARYSTREAKTILLNISAGDSCRYWEAQKWEAVAGFCEKKGFRVLLSFVPPDAALAQHIHARQPAVELFISSSIKDMIALMPDMRVVVSPDTSIVHIASAFNIPQIALFPASEWNLNKFRPLSDLSIVLQPGKEAAISTIPAADVVKALESLCKRFPHE
jgi:ADP-heptose:LPS heptosyltransferase